MNALKSNISFEVYLCDTSSVVTVDDVDMTFLPVTSTASQTLPVSQEEEKEK